MCTYYSGERNRLTQTHSFKKSAPLLDPYQWPYRTQSSAYRGLRARYLLVSTACCSTVIYYFAVTKSPTRRLCLITPVKPQLQSTSHRHHKGVAGADRHPPC